MISEKILVAVDENDQNQNAFRWICKTAKRTKSVIVATYVNVIPYSEPLNAEIPRVNIAEKVLSVIEAIANEEKVKIQTKKELILGEGFKSNPNFTEYEITKISGIFNLNNK